MNTPSQPNRTVIIVGSVLAIVLIIVAVTGTVEVRMYSFAAMLVLLTVYAVWRRAWWMLIAIVVGALFGVLT